MKREEREEREIIKEAKERRESGEKGGRTHLVKLIGLLLLRLRLALVSKVSVNKQEDGEERADGQHHILRHLVVFFLLDARVLEGLRDLGEVVIALQVGAL